MPYSELKDQLKATLTFTYGVEEARQNVAHELNIPIAEVDDDAVMSRIQDWIAADFGMMTPLVHLTDENGKGVDWGEWD